MEKDEQLNQEIDPTDEWVANLMGSLVSTIAMAVEDAKQIPDWLEVSFLSGDRVVRVEVTIQDRNSTPNRFLQQCLTKSYGTTNT